VVLENSKGFDFGLLIFRIRYDYMHCTWHLWTCPLSKLEYIICLWYSHIQSCKLAVKAQKRWMISLTGVYSFFLVRFLQGPGTDRSTVQKIRDAVDTCNDITVQLLNYTKTGNTFFIACLLCAKTNVPRFYLESLRWSTITGCQQPWGYDVNQTCS
jgi:hypothetical protein